MPTSSVFAPAAGPDDQGLLPRDTLGGYSVWCVREPMLFDPEEDVRNEILSMMKQVLQEKSRRANESIHAGPSTSPSCTAST
jgi:hypothetical protein